MFGPLFGLSDDVVRVAPFGAAPIMSGDAVDIRGLWWLVAVAVVGAAASIGLMRRRELAAGG